MTPADYEKGLAVIGQRFVALDSGGDDYPAVSERVGDCDDDADDYDMLHVALSRLNPREQHIMKAIYGINCDQRTQRDIGAELGVSGSRIGAIERVCKIKLKQFLKKLNPG
jgi:RNA polymerase sigma factor (sigma-70 family)